MDYEACLEWNGIRSPRHCLNPGAGRGSYKQMSKYFCLKTEYNVTVDVKVEQCFTKSLVFDLESCLEELEKTYIFKFNKAETSYLAKIRENKDTSKFLCD